MVELAEIQAAYYMVAATGVLVAAIYYVFTHPDVYVGAIREWMASKT